MYNFGYQRTVENASRVALPGCSVGLVPALWDFGGGLAAALTDLPAPHTKIN